MNNNNKSHECVLSCTELQFVCSILILKVKRRLQSKLNNNKTGEIINQGQQKIWRLFLKTTWESKDY